MTQPRIQLPFHYTEQNMFSLENFRVCGKFGILIILMFSFIFIHPPTLEREQMHAGAMPNLEFSCSSLAARV